MVISEIPFIFPPDFPVNKMVVNPLYCACLIAACTFSELPLVEIPINTSPVLPMPCRSGSSTFVVPIPTVCDEV